MSGRCRGILRAGPPKWTDLPHPGPHLGSLRFLGAANARGLQRRALLAASWAAALDNGAAPARRGKPARGRALLAAQLASS